MCQVPGYNEHSSSSRLTHLNAPTPLDRGGISGDLTDPIDLEKCSILNFLARVEINFLLEARKTLALPYVKPRGASWQWENMSGAPSCPEKRQDVAEMAIRETSKNGQF